jgi:hypothetical protein
MPPTLKPKELRPLLHRKLDELPDADLETVRKALIEIEIRHLRNSIGEAADEALATLKPGEIEAAIGEHRACHPYR